MAAIPGRGRRGGFEPTDEDDTGLLRDATSASFKARLAALPDVGAGADLAAVDLPREPLTVDLCSVCAVRFGP